ncbi:MAG: CRTAC1 family protein [candidate division WOR-3 bacterium]
MAKIINLFLMLGAAMATATAQVTFTRRTPAELGIDTIFSSASNSFVDYNQDGFLDFFSNVVYLNDGTGAHFIRLDSTRIFESELVDWADFNGDGYPDMVTNRRFGGNTYDTNFVLIYKNEGPPFWTLRNVSESLGLGRLDTIFDRDLVDPAWFDCNGDGFLDFFLTSYEWPPNSAQGKPDYLFLFSNGGEFIDYSDISGVSIPWYCSRGVSLFDFDEDGDVDVFVSVYRLLPNLLWQNNGEGIFIDVAEEKGVQGLYIGGYYGHNIGAAIADYNNDGHLDIFTPITHHPGYPGDSTGHLWINNGPPNWDFTCHFQGSGMKNTEIGSSPSCGDFDNDGDVDLFWTNLYGAPRPDFYLYRNEGNCHFTDVSDSLGLGPRQCVSYGIWVDFNNDGALDLFWARSDGSTTYYEFWVNSGNSNHWLELDLKGDYPNTSAIGARIDVWADSLRVTREVLHNQGGHYGSLFVPRQHFGLGQHSAIDSVVIRWPDGSRTVTQVPIDTIITIFQSPPGVQEKSQGMKPKNGRMVIKGQDIELSISGSCAIIVDGLGRIQKRLLPERNGQASWCPKKSGVYFVVNQKGRTEKVIVP